MRPFSLDNSGEERPKIFIPSTKIRHTHLKHYIGIRVPSFLKVLLFVGTPCSTKQPSSWAGRCWRPRPPAARRWCSTLLPILAIKRWLCTSRGEESLWEKFRSNESHVSWVKTLFFSHVSFHFFASSHFLRIWVKLIIISQLWNICNIKTFCVILLQSSFEVAEVLRSYIRGRGGAG